MNRYTKTNTNTNRSDFDTAADLQLSSTSNLSNSSSFQQQQQQQGQHQGGGGRSLTNNQDGHINDLFQDSGTNKPVKISPSNKHGFSHSFFADLNDINKPSRQDTSRRNKFIEKRRRRTEKHVMEHAEGILLQVLNTEAELQPPQDHQEEYIAAINGRSSRTDVYSAHRSERHHLAVALDIFGEEIDDDEQH